MYIKFDIQGPTKLVPSSQSDPDQDRQRGGIILQFIITSMLMFGYQELLGF